MTMGQDIKNLNFTVFLRDTKDKMWLDAQDVVEDHLALLNRFVIKIT